MARKRFTVEQSIIKLREAEAALAQEQTLGSHPLTLFNSFLTLGPRVAHFR